MGEIETKSEDRASGLVSGLLFDFGSVVVSIEYGVGKRPHLNFERSCIFPLLEGICNVFQIPVCTPFY